MLRIRESKNGKAAKKYFVEELSRSDYYARDCIGTWLGKGAIMLGLTGDVIPRQFEAMCDNRHPTKGGPLTERTIDGRRVGYDFNFNANKTPSVMYAITKDTDILTAFQFGVRETMSQMEGDMKCRVRVGGADFDRTVGNLCSAEFIHFTARPIDGIPDPHIHAHCFSFNAVWDAIEGKWKAGQFGELKRNAPFYEACFQSRFAAKLVELGYSIERRGNSWELTAVPESAAKQFSRRTAEIDAKAKELGIVDAERKSKLGAQTRKGKNSSLPLENLHLLWSEQVDEGTKKSMREARSNGSGKFGFGLEKSAERAIEYAMGTCFDKEAVVTEKQLLTAALRRTCGSVTVEQLKQVINDDVRFITKDVEGERHLTTKDILGEEARLIAFARNGRGTCKPIAPGHVILDERLNVEQRAAVMHVAESTDRVITICGGAGTGKTTLLTETVNAINGSWLKQRVRGGELVTVLAPSADASRGVLRQEGFEGADTVAKFLTSQRMQDAAKNGFIWVDEAGLLGTRTMAKLLDVAERINARIVLSGDRAQHRAVERGDPLALLEDYAGIRPAHVSEIQRQRGPYKQIVDRLSRGDVKGAVAGLQAHGRILEVDQKEAHTRIAFDYAETVRRGHSALIVSPTHAEGTFVTKAVRDELEKRGKLRGKGRKFDRLEDLRWTEAEKRQSDLYEKGMVIRAHQNVHGLKAGKKYSVVGRIPGVGIMLNNAMVLPLSKAAAFNVYRETKKATEIKKGDLIRITCNGRTEKAQPGPFRKARQHAINNGATYHVAGFTRAGHIRLTNGWVVNRDFGHFTHGYCTTSHASQGKTTDFIFVAQSTNSFGASTAQQFYVSVSRGKIGCFVYTDDIKGLIRHIERTVQKSMAVELSAYHQRERWERLATETAKKRVREWAQERRREQSQKKQEAQEMTYV